MAQKKAAKETQSKSISARNKTLVGLGFIVFSLFLLIAFTTYFLSWKEDFSLVANKSFWALIQSDEAVNNRLGKLGAYLSHLMVYRSFGISALLFVPFIFLVGAKIIGVFKELKLKKVFRHLIWALVLLPLLLSTLTGSGEFIGGRIGYVMYTEGSLVLGKAGLLLLVLFLIFSYSFIYFPESLKKIFAFLKAKINSIGQNKTSLGQVKPSPESDFEKVIRENVLDDDDLHETSLNNEEPEPIVTEIKTEEPETTIEKPKPIISSDDDMEIEIAVEDPIIEETPVVEDSPEEMDITVGESDEMNVSDKKWKKLVEEQGQYDPKLDLSDYKMPNLSLLADHGDKKRELEYNEEELIANKNKIKETLGHYKIGVDKVKVTVGPTVTLYEIIPEAGVRISKIKNLEDDIALSLAALGIRIIAPMPGKGTIGIEVPNTNPAVVSMRSLLKSEKFVNSKYELPVALGKTINNEVFVADLAKMPHLLMAGATGQGKSVGLNAILVSLLYKKHPSQLKFVLVDPKKVELTLFNKIERHFLAKLPDEEDAIITDTLKVVKTLNSLCKEMDERYDLLKAAMVRNIKEYNEKFTNRRLNPEKGHRYLPYIVLVVDEFADLIMTAGKEVEQPIARLAQLARAIGIHLIIATQRPSVNIITGIIKANFPARIAFRVTSKIDSRTILDAGGADQLIGRGDLLYSPGNEIVRLQCGFVDTPEVDDICDYIGSQRAYPTALLLPEVDEDGGSADGMGSDEPRDVLFEEAARTIVLHQQGSTSLLQRKMSIGYNRAGRIIDQLESVGIIGPHEGSKSRKVNYPDIISLEQFLTSLK
jgi:S-DNA-T family DNA segregation ATPase FtsK/SpoIIIE